MKNFIVPKTEKYTCSHCGKIIIGGRYNNHCPHCLWSKHLDDQIPGDRASKCKSLMEPSGVVQKNGKWRIVHQCLSCKKDTVVDSSPEDNSDLIIELSQRPLSDNYLK
ncbi:RNHCP domain-containing protein [Candidatus Collierbacteria bacterium]|nr:RNHCP domain-containing protein [Candidatus Collierbacteria bacterium]